MAHRRDEVLYIACYVKQQNNSARDWDGWGIESKLSIHSKYAVKSSIAALVHRILMRLENPRFLTHIYYETVSSKGSIQFKAVNPFIDAIFKKFQMIYEL